MRTGATMVTVGIVRKERHGFEKYAGLFPLPHKKLWGGKTLSSLSLWELPRILEFLETELV